MMSNLQKTQTPPPLPRFLHEMARLAIQSQSAVGPNSTLMASLAPKTRQFWRLFWLQLDSRPEIEATIRPGSQGRPVLFWCSGCMQAEFGRTGTPKSVKPI